MLAHSRRIAALSTACLLALTFPTAAETTSVADDSAEQRINLSGKLRMLSQRIPSAACHLANGVDTEGSKALLLNASAEFEAILNALENGDPEMNIIKPEERKKTLMQISDLKEKWAPMKEAALATADGSATAAQQDYILMQNMTVLGSAVTLVSELSEQYANPNAVSQANLLLVDISGRQRMLTQKMSKESCLAGTEYSSTSTIEDMNQTIQIFEASLEALKFGMPALGIAAPPNSDISDGLDVVFEDWQQVKPVMLEIASGGTVDGDQSTFKFQQLNTTMANMNKVVGMYVDAVKPKNGVQLN